MPHCYGYHAVASLLRHRPAAVTALLLRADGKATRRYLDLKSLAKRQGVAAQAATVDQLDELAGTSRHQGVCASYKPLSQDLGVLLSGVGPETFWLILDGVQDPHNLGACLRTAHAAGVQAVFAPKDGSVALTPVVHKVASGAAALIPYIQVKNLSTFLRKIKKLGVWLKGSHEDASADLYGVDFEGPLAIVMGAEGPGLRELTRKQCDGLFHIPTQASFSTLNVSVATGVALFEARRQRGLRS